MPLGPPTLPIFQSAFLSHGLIGPGTAQLAVGCSNGLQQYMTVGCTTISIDVGTLGAGTGFGFGIVLPQPVLTGAMTSFFAGLLIGGPFGPVTASAISFGISNSLSTSALVNTINAGVGVGAGKVQFIPNGIGGNIFTAAFLAAGMTGPMIPSLGQAVGGAMDSVIASALGIVAIAGPPNILPGGGVGIGTVS